MRPAARRYRSIVADSRRWDGFEFREDEEVDFFPGPGRLFDDGRGRLGDLTKRPQLASGFEVEQVEVFDDRRLALEPWLDRVEVPTEDRPRIRKLLGAASDGETVRMPIIVMQARKSRS